MSYAMLNQSLIDPFEIAARKAKLEGICPISLLDDFYTNHWDCVSLCASFNCSLCVATPEDFGYTEDEREYPDLVVAEENEEIPV